MVYTSQQSALQLKLYHNITEYDSTPYIGMAQKKDGDLYKHMVSLHSRTHTGAKLHFINQPSSSSTKWETYYSLQM